MRRTSLVALALWFAFSAASLAGDKVVGTLTVKGKPVPLKFVAAALQTDPDDAERSWLVLLASDVAVAPADRTPGRLAELAATGKVRAVRVLWLQGADTVFAVPYLEGLEASGRRGLEHPTIDLERWDETRFEGSIKSKMMGQDWFFQAQIKADVVRGGVAELEGFPAEQVAGSGAGATSAGAVGNKTQQKLQLAKLGYEYTEEMLPHAIQDANVEAVKLFLAIGMSPNTGAPSSEQPLAIAVTQCAYEHEAEAVEMAKAMLAAGAKVDAGAKDGITPLLNAAQNCKGVELVKMLLAAGANANTKAPGGATPLMFAKIFNKKDMEEVLRQAGARD
jgi:uncharacterized protein